MYLFERTRVCVYIPACACVPVHPCPLTLSRSLTLYKEKEAKDARTFTAFTTFKRTSFEMEYTYYLIFRFIKHMLNANNDNMVP